MDLRDQRGELFRSLRKWRGFEDLRADVGLDPRIRRCGSAAAVA